MKNKNKLPCARVPATDPIVNLDFPLKVYLQGLARTLEDSFQLPEKLNKKALAEIKKYCVGYISAFEFGSKLIDEALAANPDMPKEEEKEEEEDGCCDHEDCCTDEVECYECGMCNEHCTCEEEDGCCDHVDGCTDEVECYDCGMCKEHCTCEEETDGD